MSFLSARERDTLRLVCDTLVPALAPTGDDDPRLMAHQASALQVPEQIAAMAGAHGKRRLTRLLALLENRCLGGVMAGTWRPFSQLSLDDRTRVLRGWSDSRMEFARGSFQALKRLSMLLSYGGCDADGMNPAWEVFGYHGPLTESSVATAPGQLIRPLMVDRATTLDADVLIVGSGAGGGVVASELSAAGLDVLVVEKGGYFTDAELGTGELDGLNKLYERRGSLSTADLSVVVLAGSTVGGGTTVNWTTSLRPPSEVLEEWSREYGFTAATGTAFQESLDAVSDRLNVNTFESDNNVPNELLERGCQELGFQCRVIPRNVRGCTECDFCGFGCRHGAKQDTRSTYLQEAHQRGTRILPRAHVDRILHQTGRVTGAELTVRGTGDQVQQVTVRAKIVVVAAGAIHTPAVLRRSGLSNRQIGENLHLHPTTAVFARYPQAVYSWKGAPQTRVCDELANLSGDGYGVRLEVCPAHPGLSALGLPWQSGRQHKRYMQQLAFMSNIIILTRDRFGGRVKLNRAGQPIMHYRLHPADASHMLEGVIAALRVQRAAGAVEVFSPHANVLSFQEPSGSDFEDYLARVRKRPIRPNAFGLFSAHQLSTCRIASDPRRGAVDPAGQSYEVRNLYVADGSVLPTACGVNPMITIMGLAHYIAQQIKSR